MQNETGSALAAKSIATGLAAAFGLTWTAFAAAIVGAVVSLHWQEPASGSTVWRVILQISALTFLAACLGSSLPDMPGCEWTADVPVAVRCGLLGMFGNPIAKGISALINFFIARRTQGGG